MSLSSAQRSRLDAMAKELREIFGSGMGADGRPKTFAELEDECVEVGDLLTATVLQQLVARRESPQDAHCCPDCHHPGELLPDEEVRLLQTDRGEIAWAEPTYYCRLCRRSFFPSVG